MSTIGKLVEVVYVEDIVGKGGPDDPVQQRQLLFTRSGQLIATRTALGEGYVAQGDGWRELAKEEPRK